MKAAAILHHARGLLIFPFLVACALLPPQLSAQDNGYLAPSEQYSREELAQMLAPIALYPDALLSQVLMASTYPIEVVEADRWISRHPGLKGDALDTALLDMDWDPSVQALCHFPSILALMSERISETTNLGNAFLAQEADVMDMVQELRAKAYAQHNLVSTDRQTVIVRDRIIIIEPANPRVIYLPYYDPYYIYGPWWYPAYPPYYWGPPGVSVGVGISYWPGISFGFIFGGWSYFDWPHRYIYVDVHKRPRYVRRDRWRTESTHWHHDTYHRRGVAYRDIHTAREYGQYPRHSRDFGRDLRGFPDSRDGDRQGDERTGIVRDRTRTDRTTIDRDRRTHTPVAPAGSTGEPADRDRRERGTDGQTTQPRERIDRTRQIQQRPDQKSPAPERPVRSRTAPTDRVPDRRHDNVFNRVDNATLERESSKRGRDSRQGAVGKRRSDSPVGRGSKGSRDDQTPNRR